MSQALDPSLVALDFLRHPPVIFYVIELLEDGFRVIWASPNSQERLGFTLEEAQVPGWWEARLHPEDRVRVEQEMGEVLQGRLSRQTYRFIRKDGSVLWVLDTMVHRPAGGGLPARIHGAWCDISELRVENGGVAVSAERARLALEATAQGIWDLDLVNDVATVNAEYATMLGYDVSEFRESNAAWRTRLHPEDQVEAGRVFDEYIAGERPEYSLEFRIRTADGGWKWVLSVGEIVERAPDGTPLRMLGTHTDITALKESEIRAQASARFNEELLEQVSEAVVACDALGRLTTFNRLARDWHGLPPDASLPPEEWSARYTLLREDGRTSLPPEEIPLVRAFRGEVVKDVPMCIATPGQPPRRVLASGGPLQAQDGASMGAVILMRDVTQEREAEAAVRLRESALQAAATAIVITDRKGVVEWANPAFTELTGYTLEEAVGKNPRELVRSGDQDPAFYRDLWDTILEGRSWSGELINRRKDGSRYPEALTINPVVNDAGEVEHFVAFKRDLTEERAEQARFLQAQKMESVGRLAGGVAHDFNNLLTVISGSVELALTGVSAHDPLHRHLLEVQEAADRATALTRQLLAFSRHQVLHPEVVEFNQVVEAMVKLLQRLLGEDLTLGTELDPGAGWVQADVSQLEQVIVNLAVNARDAMPGGGTLTLSTSPVTGTLPVTRDGAGRDLTTGEYLRLTVRDTGVGMSPAVKARLFEPFFTTKPQGKGTGLGLSTVYGIVEQSGGAITVESELGVGSAFHVFLPRIAAPSPESATVRGQGEAELLPGSGAVLVVDDEGAVRGVTKRILERAGYTVITAGSGEEALGLLDRRPMAVDLLLTDVVMPGMSGPELLKVLRERMAGLRVLFTSGYASDTMGEHGFGDEEFPFLPKPFTIAQLTAKVREVLKSGD